MAVVDRVDDDPPPPPPPPPPPVTVRVVPKHHALVRLSHWANVPLLFGLIATGLAIYWAAPVLRDPVTHRHDVMQDVSRVIAGWLHASGDPRAWIYDHLSLGRFQLAPSLRLHWLLAYLFMINGVFYLIGLLAGGGWRALLPRPSDVRDGLSMIRYYLGIVPMAMRRKPWPHPVFASKYNALQRAAYFSMPVFGLLVVLSGWAMHKPAMLGWLERLFINYDGARLVHFVSMIVLGSFVIPHVILVIADGWDTFRSMVVGWSARGKGEPHE